MKSWWSNARHTAFEKISAFFGITRGQILPKPLMALACLLFPSRGLLILCEKISPLGYDVSRHALKLQGYWIDLRSLTDFANYPKGTVFEVVNKDKETGLITLRIVSPPIVCCGQDLPEGENLRPAGRILRLIKDAEHYPDEVHS